MAAAIQNGAGAIQNTYIENRGCGTVKDIAVWTRKQ